MQVLREDEFTLVYPPTLLNFHNIILFFFFFNFPP